MKMYNFIKCIHYLSSNHKRLCTDHTLIEIQHFKFFLNHHLSDGLLKLNFIIIILAASQISQVCVICEILTKRINEFWVNEY